MRPEPEGDQRRAADLWRSAAGASAAVALAAFLPFLRGVLTGQSFYFRDLSRQFFPLRRFAVEGLLEGEVRYWNPFLHEGVPLSLPAVSYLPDLLQMLVPNEAGFTLLLALHVPLGALTFMLLARRLGVGSLAAAAGSLVYALGGFYLSCVNLYVYVEAAAWAPLIVLGLVGAARGSRRWQVGAALATAVALSSTGVEIVAQAIVLGLVLALSLGTARGLLRCGWALLLGFGLAAPTLCALSGVVADSARGHGFPTAVVLAHSVHPLALLQSLVGNLLGDVGNIANDWWGSNFFPLGFPYVLSLYVGSTTLSVAAVGALHGQGPRRSLVALALLATAACLGRWAHLEGLVEAISPLHVFRYPSKAFFTVHIAVALLTSLGIEELVRAATGRPWRTFAGFALGFGGLLTTVPALQTVLPSPTHWFLEGFLPPSYSWHDRVAVAERIARDAATGGGIAVVAGTVAILTLGGRLAPKLGALAVVALVSADLLRTGAGLNPMVTSDFYRLSPEMNREAEVVRRSGGRLFSCDPESGPAYFLGRRAQGRNHDVWTFAAFMETLTPAYNVAEGVPTAYSRDLTMLVPETRVLPPEDASAAAFGSVEARLRAAGVASVVCLEPISHPHLRLRHSVEPERVFPLIIRIYDVTDPIPLRSIARRVRPATNAQALGGHEPGQDWTDVTVEDTTLLVNDATGRVLRTRDAADAVELDVEADRPTMAVVRDAFAPGWSAEVNGAPAPVLRADGRYRAIPVPAGRSRVLLRYHPPGLRTGLTIFALAATLAALTLWSGREPTGSPPTETA